MAKTLCIALKSTALVAEVRHKLLSHSGSEATLEEFAPFLIICCFRRASSSIEKNLLMSKKLQEGCVPCYTGNTISMVMMIRKSPHT